MYHKKRKNMSQKGHHQNQDQDQSINEQDESINEQDQSTNDQNQSANDQNQSTTDKNQSTTDQAQEKSNADHDQFCFVHRLSDLPLISFSIDQFLHYYEKTKKYNRLLGASLHMAENSVKYAAGKTEPFRKLLDGPIVASNKIACRQLEKLEKRYPAIQTTPQELLRFGKSYYEKSLVKSGVDKASSVVVFGENKYRKSKKFASDVVTGILYVGTLKFSDMVRLSLETINQTLVYSDSIIDTYVAPPNFEHNGPLQNEIGFSIISRMYSMSTKVIYGLKYKAGTGIEMTRDQAMQVFGQMHAVLSLLDHAKNSSQWLTDEAITKFSVAQSNVANLLREIKTMTEKYGKKPDIVLLKSVQKATSTFVRLSDFLNKTSAPFLPQLLRKNVQIAVQYAHDLSETFNKATTLGELKDDVIKEAWEKFAFVQSVFLSVFDRVVVYPPISWLVSFSRNNGIILKQNVVNGEVADGGTKTRTRMNKTQ